MGMKKILAILATLLTINAYATEWAMPNKNGGYIYATNTLCSGYTNQFIIYSRMATWNDGSTYSYPTSAFVEVK
jgi:hypothetical protein